MKKYKSIDFYVQVICLLMVAVAVIINNPALIDPFIFMFLFALLQVTSILLHFFTGLQAWEKTALRKYHLIGIALALISLVVAFIQNSSGRLHDKYSMNNLEILIWTAIPTILSGFFYIIITWLEWINIKKRELTQFR